MAEGLWKKARRRPRFTEAEMLKLVEGVKERSEMILGKPNMMLGVTVQQACNRKQQAWEEISDIVNTVSMVSRTAAELRRKFKDMKSHLRAKAAKEGLAGATLQSVYTKAELELLGLHPPLGGHSGCLITMPDSERINFGVPGPTKPTARVVVDALSSPSADDGLVPLSATSDYLEDPLSCGSTDSEDPLSATTITVVDPLPATRAGVGEPPTSISIGKEDLTPQRANVGYSITPMSAAVVQPSAPTSAAVPKPLTSKGDGAIIVLGVNGSTIPLIPVYSAGIDDTCINSPASVTLTPATSSQTPSPTSTQTPSAAPSQTPSAAQYNVQSAAPRPSPASQLPIHPSKRKGRGVHSKADREQELHQRLGGYSLAMPDSEGINFGVPGPTKPTARVVVDALSSPSAEDGLVPLSATSDYLEDPLSYVSSDIEDPLSATTITVVEPLPATRASPCGRQGCHMGAVGKPPISISIGKEDLTPQRANVGYSITPMSAAVVQPSAPTSAASYTSASVTQTPSAAPSQTPSAAQYNVQSAAPRRSPASQLPIHPSKRKGRGLQSKADREEGFQMVPDFLTTQKEMRDLLQELVEAKRSSVAAQQEIVTVAREGVAALQDLAQSHQACSKAILALAQSNRQHAEDMENQEQGGVRRRQIAKRARRQR